MRALHGVRVSPSSTQQRGAQEQSLTFDLPMECSGQKGIFPVGITKVLHYHLNVADCIFVSLHFSLPTFL